MRYLLIILFPLFSFAQQAPCTDCPKSLKTPGAVRPPQPKFTGYTSLVDTFDGVAPTCFLPEDTTLNGVIAGIDNALCLLRTRMDSISVVYGNDTAYLNTIDSILNELNNIYETEIISSDGTIDVSSSDSANYTIWDLVVNIDSVISQLNRGLDYACLDPNAPACDTLLTSEFQRLIDNIALLYAPSADTCVAWDFYCNVGLITYDSSSILDIEPLSDTITGTPADMCLDVIQYILYVVDSGGNVIYNTLVTAPSSLGLITYIEIPYGYANGATSLYLTARFNKYQCVSYDSCGYFDYTETISFAGP